MQTFQIGKRHQFQQQFSPTKSQVVRQGGFMAVKPPNELQQVL